MFEIESLLDVYCKEQEKKYKLEETKNNQRYRFKK